MAPVRAGLSRRPPIAGAVLAGGSSSRFGTDKSLASTPEGPLGGIAVQALRQAGVDPVVLIGASPDVSAHLGVPAVPDLMPGEGPLAALWTALRWASGVARVVVIPCDMPHVDGSVVRAIVAAGDNSSASVASLGERPHPIVGCWPVAWASSVHGLLRAGERRMSAVLDLGPFHTVEIEQQRLADADDPDELERAFQTERRLQ